MLTSISWDHIFEMLGDLDLEYINISSLFREVVPPMVKGSHKCLGKIFSKEERSIQGVV